MKIKINITFEEMEAIKEWKPMLEYAKKEYMLSAYPEDHDYSINAPEIVEEQRFIKKRIGLISNLVNLSEKILKETDD